MPEAASRRDAPIGVFDSGVGGLTVLRALRAALPAEDFVYLGDTARLPYGSKSAQTVCRYSLQAAEVLVQRGVKMLVVACNTASSVALDALRERHARLPVVGVLEPGAAAAAAATQNGAVAVIATEGTVRGGAYPRAIESLRPGLRVVQRACPLFVALAEEGWTDGPVAEAVARRYLEPLFSVPDAPDTLLLGCTHFPALMAPIRRAVGDRVMLVDSAATTARATAEGLATLRLAKEAGIGRLRLLATDGPERFARVGALFAGESVAAEDVELVDL
ncbi:MAG: glutamate racemase [Steroidobacteraceae bacterium]|jgi:glutamate racemase|nr:glutamate racemase [Steroidobacteraceae bacterium]